MPERVPGLQLRMPRFLPGDMERQGLCFRAAPHIGRIIVPEDGMDSVTQFALGACVGAATLGPRIGMRKAALIGGLMGTVPDLDLVVTPMLHDERSRQLADVEG